MAKNVNVTKGSKVNLVLANGKAVPAEVTAVRKGGLVDLQAEVNGETVTITSSPLDETGKKPDSWCPAEEPAKEPAKTETK